MLLSQYFITSHDSVVGRVPLEVSVPPGVGGWPVRHVQGDGSGAWLLLRGWWDSWAPRGPTAGHADFLLDGLGFPKVQKQKLPGVKA